MAVPSHPVDRLPDDDVVETIAQFADAVAVSIATARRVIKEPDGPVVTRLSSRRLGITRRHRREWLARRSVRMETLDA